MTIESRGHMLPRNKASIPALSVLPLARIVPQARTQKTRAQTMWRRCLRRVSARITGLEQAGTDRQAAMWSGANAGKGRGGKTYGKGKTSKGWTSSNWDVTHSWDSAGKGKGADWGSTGDWQQNWTEEKGQAKGKAGQTRDYIPRLEGRYAFSKAVLRPYCDEQGS